MPPLQGGDVRLTPPRAPPWALIFSPLRGYLRTQKSGPLSRPASHSWYLTPWPKPGVHVFFLASVTLREGAWNLGGAHVRRSAVIAFHDGTLGVLRLGRALRSGRVVSVASTPAVAASISSAAATIAATAASAAVTTAITAAASAAIPATVEAAASTAVAATPASVTAAASRGRGCCLLVVGEGRQILRKT